MPTRDKNKTQRGGVRKKTRLGRNYQKEGSVTGRRPSKFHGTGMPGRQRIPQGGDAGDTLIDRV